VLAVFDMGLGGFVQHVQGEEQKQSDLPRGVKIETPVAMVVRYIGSRSTSEGLVAGKGCFGEQLGRLVLARFNNLRSANAEDRDPTSKVEGSCA